MYRILVTLMLLAALSELGITLAEFRDCHDWACLQKFEQASRKVLNIDWKPISVFPEEAKKFK